MKTEPSPVQPQLIFTGDSPSLPRPLPEELPPVMPFSEALLPEGLTSWVMDTWERMQCPPDYPAVAAMVALAGVVGQQIAVGPQAETDWLVIPNLWGLLVGRGC
ncbi:MAG: DUF3987 domain-containing protein [Desulfuromonadales bacterium]|nr:DUF3987 domain-containing protein [Desulfuromonadales bacterium]